MLNFKLLEEAKKSTFERDEELSEKAKEAYEQAVVFIQKFQKTKESKELTNAANKLYESIKYKRKQVEPYIWLSYIFHVMEKEDKAIKYLKIAEHFDPKHPKIPGLKTLIQEASRKKLNTPIQKVIRPEINAQQTGSANTEQELKNKLNQRVKQGIEEMNTHIRVEPKTLRRLAALPVRRTIFPDAKDKEFYQEDSPKINRSSSDSSADFNTELEKRIKSGMEEINTHIRVEPRTLKRLKSINKIV